MCEAGCRKDGKELTGERFPQLDEVDLAKVPAGLHLVKDSGVYLMSNGTPRLLAPGKKDSSQVVYAQGHSPADEWIGGDDFCDFLSLDTFEDIIAKGGKMIVITVTERTVTIRYS
jgi:hypothetical protein